MMPELTEHVCRVVINAPIQQVWDALTRHGEVLPHFFGSVMHSTGLQAGAQLRMRTPGGKYTGVVGEILECDPPHRFSHTFRFTNLNDPPCVVTYELREVADGVEFTLISSRIPAGTKTEKQMIQGSQFITAVLKSVLETGKPSLGHRILLRVIGAMTPFTPAACRSEHWPLDRAV